MKYLVLLIFLTVGCVSDNEVNISANTTNNPAEAGTGGEGSGGEGSGGEASGGEASGGGGESEGTSSSVNLIFEEDFEYTLSDGTTINTGFLTDSTFTSKWDTYLSTHQLKSYNGSISWSATGSGYWGASLITKQTFNLPITIEWDIDQGSSNSGGASAFEGLCIYEGSPATRDSNYKFAYSGTNYGCILLNPNTTNFFIYGIFIDNNNPNLLTHSNGVLKYHNLPNSVKNYRVTVNIFEDNTFDVTFQFKDEPSVPQVVYSGTLQLSDQSNALDSFKLEFNHGDYGSYRSYTDNIKVWDGDMSPSPL